MANLSRAVCIVLESCVQAGLEERERKRERKESGMSLGER